MHNMDLATYEQAVALQARLVNRAILQRTQVHEIDDEDERTEFGSVWLHCTCGHWFTFKADDSERAERVYTRHVAEDLRSRLAVAA